MLGRLCVSARLNTCAAYGRYIKTTRPVSHNRLWQKIPASQSCLGKECLITAQTCTTAKCCLIQMQLEEKHCSMKTYVDLTDKFFSIRLVPGPCRFDG